MDAKEQVKEILLLNYWEHIKVEKDLSRIFPPEDSKRVDLNKAAHEILEKINTLRP